MTLSSFVLVGTILSHDAVLATVEFNLNPATNAGPSLAIMQTAAIPCKIEVGTRIFVVKNKNEETSTITCEKQEE